MKSLSLAIAALIISSCTQYVQQARQDDIQKHKNQCLQTGLKENTNSFSQCLSLNIYKAQAIEKSKLNDVGQLLIQKRPLEMIQKIASQ